jgi:hypothetical protein
MAAGIHPISVICRKRHMTPANGRPIVKNEINGKNIASNKRIDVFLK